MADKLLFEIVVDTKGVPKGVKQVKQAKKGVDDLSRSTKNLEKKQSQQYTRQKQGVIQTANSTKNFSKMQQSVDGGGGAGGLVRAYALLAANVFALTAAFGVLSRSAQIDTLIESMEILSTTGGVYIKTIAKDMQIASGYAIDLAQAFSQVSLASSAGLSTKEIEGLTLVAKGAAISLGRDLPDAMDRIFRGAIKMEPEILDEIGLFVRVDEAAQQYARELGKSTAALTVAEKRQGFLNAILEQGINKFEEYASAIDPDIYTQLSSALFDLAQSATSVINSVLGPAIRFLTENPKILALAFGALVTFLLSKAIPALGVFNFDVAAGAAQAVAAEQKYINKIKETLNVEISKEQQVQQEVLETQRIKGKAMMQSSKDMKKFPSRATGAKANLKALKKETDAEKKILLIGKRKGILEKASKKAKGENLALIEKEIKARKKEVNNLKRQVTAEQKILALQKEQTLEANKKYLAGKRLAKLQAKATSTTIVAGATGIAETEGMKSGFANLRKTLSEGIKDEVTGTTHKLTGMKKGLTAVKGGISIVGVGFQNLMSTLMPFIMLFTILLPILIKIGEYFGLNSEEASKFDETLKKVTESSKNLHKRFDAQIKASINVKSTFLEKTKAILAYNKAQSEVMDNVIALTDDFRTFQETASGLALFWEGFKKLFNLDRESRMIAENINVMRKSIIGAADKDDKELINIYNKAGLAAGVLAEARGKERAAVDKLAAAKKKLLDLNYEEADLDAIINKGQSTRILGASGLRDAAYNLTKLNKIKQEEGKELLILAIDQHLAEIQLIKSGKNLGETEDNMREAAEKLLPVLKNRVQIYQAYVSTLEEAKDSVGKFQQAFMAKTKVDEITSGLTALIVNTDKLKELDVTQYAESLKKLEESPFGVLFDFRDADLKPEDIKKVLMDAKKNLDIYRYTIIKSAADIKKYTQTQKLMNEFSAAGIEINKKAALMVTKIAKEKAKIQSMDNKALALTFGLGTKTLEQAISEYENKKKGQKISEDITAFYEDDLKLLQARNALEKQHQAELEVKLAFETQSERAQIAYLKAQQKIVQAAKELTDAKLKQLELDMKLARLAKTGSSALGPIGEYQLAIKSAKVRMQSTIAEAEIKMLMIEAEEELLKERLRVIAEDRNWSEAKLDKHLANIGRATTLQQQALAITMSNAAKEFGLELETITKKSFSSGLQMGIAASQAGLVERLAGIEDKRREAQERNDRIYEGYAGKDRIKAETDTKFDTEESTVRRQEGFKMLRQSMEAYADTLNKLGPEGELVSAVVMGALAISDSFQDMAFVVGDKGATAMEKGAAVAAFAAQSFAQIGQMMAANSKAQIAEVDQQIAAEKRRDGKSAESLARIKAMEKKKEGLARKAFEQNKKMQMATVIANTAASIMQVWANPADVTKVWAIGMTAVIAAMGIAQLAIISKTKFSGGGGDVQKPTPTKLSIGKRSEKVDVSRGANMGELSYLRGERGMGQGANRFTPTGGAAGLRRGYAEGGALVGERGPEVIAPMGGGYQIIPNDALGGIAGNINFTINAVDAEGVEDVLLRQRGHIIGMIREAANDTGERFLESVDTDVVGGG